MASQDWFEKDFYAVLGVSADADAKEIKKVYRKLARELHPDAKPGDKAAEQRFKEIGEAYAVLSDPEQRKQYDAVRAMSRGGARFTAGGAGGAGGAAGFEDIFSNLFGGGAPGAGGSYTYTTSRPGGGYGAGQGQPDFEDLLGMFTQGGFGQGGGSFGGGQPGAGGFGGGFGRQQAPPTKGRDRQATATLGFRQAVAGDVVEVRGTDGTSSKARIPAGVRDGATIRIRGKGDAGPSGTPAGDLLIKVHVKPHPLFVREGDNLLIDVPVTFAEAALGSTISVPTLTGEAVKVRLPAGTASGKTLRVKGRGVARRDHPAGDLLVKVSVVVPQRLTDEAKAAVETLAAQDDGVDPRSEVFRKAMEA